LVNGSRRGVPKRDKGLVSSKEDEEWAEIGSGDETEGDERRKIV